MANYLFISSRDPYECGDSKLFVELVEGTHRGRNHTTLFLVQNGVLRARRGARDSEVFRRLAQAGVMVIADGFSLRERAVEKLADGIMIGDIERLIDFMVEPETKIIWH